VQFSLESTFPRAGVYYLKNAVVVAPDGWVQTSNGCWLGECSWFGTCDSRWSPVIPQGTTEHLAGETLVLASDWAAGNYGHFLLDVLPRVDLIERAGWRLDNFDHILAPLHLKSFAPLLEQLGVPLNRVRCCANVAGYTCERLVAPTFPGVRRSLPPWGAAFLRARAAKQASESGNMRRLYIPRDTTRRIINEEELIERLVSYGFEIFRPATSQEDPRQAFAGAEVVVGAHGAGLADIVFAPKSSLLVEIVPSDHIFPYWFCSAASAGVRHVGAVAESLGHRGRDAWGPSPFDIEAPIELIERALDTFT
jgi:capsular polysaccharide biosynthesis protein